MMKVTSVAEGKWRCRCRCRSLSLSLSLSIAVAVAVDVAAVVAGTADEKGKMTALSGEDTHACAQGRK